MSIIFRLKTTTLIGQNSAATQIDINSLILGNYRENFKVQRLNFCKKKKNQNYKKSQTWEKMMQ